MRDQKDCKDVRDVRECFGDGRVCESQKIAVPEATAEIAERQQTLKPLEIVADLRDGGEREDGEDRRTWMRLRARSVVLGDRGDGGDCGDREDAKLTASFGECGGRPS